MRNKIRADHEKALEEAKEKLKKSREEIQAEIQTEKNKVAQEMKTKEKKSLPPVFIPNLVGIKGGDPEDNDIREKREKIKEVISCRYMTRSNNDSCLPICLDYMHIYTHTHIYT